MIKRCTPMNFFRHCDRQTTWEELLSASLPLAKAKEAKLRLDTWLGRQA